MRVKIIDLILKICYINIFFKRFNLLGGRINAHLRLTKGLQLPDVSATGFVSDSKKMNLTFPFADNSGSYHFSQLRKCQITLVLTYPAD